MYPRWGSSKIKATRPRSGSSFTRMRNIPLPPSTVTVWSSLRRRTKDIVFPPSYSGDHVATHAVCQRTGRARPTPSRPRKTRASCAESPYLLSRKRPLFSRARSLTTERVKGRLRGAPAELGCRANCAQSVSRAIRPRPRSALAALHQRAATIRKETVVFRSARSATAAGSAAESRRRRPTARAQCSVVA